MKYSLLLSIFFLFIACGGDDECTSDNIDIPEHDQDIRQLNQIAIQNYLSENGLTSTQTESGLHYIVTQEGNGNFPCNNSSVTVDYHGYFLDGEVFDSSIDRGQPATFPLTNVILGWREGVPLFSEGGEGVLLIPSHLAYGTIGRPGIPANAVLAFDIILIDL